MPPRPTKVETGSSGGRVTGSLSSSPLTPVSPSAHKALYGHAPQSNAAAYAAPQRVAITAAAAASSSGGVGRLTSPPSPSLSALSPTVLLSPENRARQLIALALREASSGKVPLQAVAVTGWCGGGGTGALVLYEVMVQGANNLRWLLTRRFAEFAALNATLESSVRNSGSLPPFPSKEWSWIVDHSAPDFVESRRALLDNYLKKVASHSKLRGSAAFLDFLRPCREDRMEGSGSQTPIIQQQLPMHPNTANGTRGWTSPQQQQRQQHQAATTAVTSDSVNDAMFEPRSFEDEQKSERQERIRSLSQAAAFDEANRSAASSGASASSSSSSSTSATPSMPVLTLTASSSFLSGGSSSQLLPTWVSPEVSDVCIPSAQILKNDHVVFQLNVENLARASGGYGDDSHTRWTVLKRYGEFRIMDDRIRAELAAKHASDPTALASALSSLPFLPPKELKLMVDHLQSRFIEKRRLLLEVYLKKIIALPHVAVLDPVLEFLGCNS